MEVTQHGISSRINSTFTHACRCHDAVLMLCVPCLKQAGPMHVLGTVPWAGQIGLLTTSITSCMTPHLCAVMKPGRTWACSVPDLRPEYCGSARCSAACARKRSMCVVFPQLDGALSVLHNQIMEVLVLLEPISATTNVL